MSLDFAVRSMHSSSNEIARLIEAGALNRALARIHDIVERVITEPLCTSHVLGSEILDQLVLRIGQASFAQLTPSPGHPVGGKAPQLYIATRLQNSGGHSRVIRDLIDAQPQARHVVLLTETEGRSDLSLFNGALVQIERAPRGNYVQRLMWLQARLAAHSPQRVFLFNHHQDSTAAAAIVPEMGLDAYFYHHGDHHLSLGVHHTHLKHLDPHPMGYHNCRESLGIDNLYLPLTFADLGYRPPSAAFAASGTITTCTAARSNKIEVPYFTSYLDLLPQIVAATGGNHIHIGKLSSGAIRRVRRGLDQLGIAQGRFFYTPHVSSVWTALHEHRVDLYIASFPYGGGLTLIEAMGAGVPVVLHRHIFSRILSGLDLGYPGAFAWRKPDELLHYCRTVTRADLEAASVRAREHYDTYHAGNNLPRFLACRDEDLPTPQSRLSHFQLERDEWGVWMEQQVSIRRIVSRLIYRLARRARGALS